MGAEVPYTNAYFEVQGYADVMLRPREVNGAVARPLAETAVDMVEAVWTAPPARLFDVGCAHGYVVQEAVARGWSARGMDLSQEVVESGPVPDLLAVGDAIHDPIEDCDVAVCLNVFEHLTPAEAHDLGRNLATHARTVLTVINKSDHDPTHVTLEGNRWWVRHLAASGLGFDRKMTLAARAAYLRSGNWDERWWNDCLVFRGSRPAGGATLAEAATFPPRFVTAALRARLHRRRS